MNESNRPPGTHTPPINPDVLAAWRRGEIKGPISNGPVDLTDEQIEAVTEVLLDHDERIAREEAAAKEVAPTPE